MKQGKSKQLDTKVIMESFFQNSLEGMMIVDRDLSIRMVNPGATNLLKCTESDLLQKHLSILFDGETAEEIKSYCNSIYTRAVLTCIFNCKMTCKNKHVFSAELKMSNHIDTFGEPVIIIVFNDISSRIEAENRAKKENEAFIQIIEEMGDSFFCLDKDWKFIYANEKALKILDKSHYEIGDRSIWDVFPELSENKIANYLKMAMNGMSVPKFNFRISKNEKYAEAKVIPHRGGIAVFLKENIEEIRKLLVKLRTSEKKFQHIFQSSPMALAIIDMNGNILNVNKSFINIFDLENLGPKKINFYNLIPELKTRYEDISTNSGRSDLPLSLTDIKLMNQFGKSINIELTADTFFINKLKSILIRVEDKTEYKRINDELMKSEERFSKAFNSSPTGMSIIRCSDGRFIDINESFLRIFGYEKSEILWKSNLELRLFLNPGMNESCFEFSEATFNNKEISGKRKDGTALNVIVSSEMVQINGEDHILISVYDITEQKKSEQALINLNQILEKRIREKTIDLTEALKKEKEINDLKSRFITMASHEFKTPLSAILSSIYLLEHYIDTDMKELQKKHIKRIGSSVSSLNNILNDFLSVEKIDQGLEKQETTEFHLPNLMKNVMEELEYLLKPGQKISIQHKGRKFIIQDQNKLHNILLNLLSNAIKYSPEDSIITIDSNSSRNSIRIEIADQGIGIPETEQQFLFTRFFRASNAENLEGTGLGLNIVKRYLNLMQGNIDFESKINKGTIFKISFPFMPRDNETIEHALQ